MCLYFALMYKTLGEYRWTDLFRTNISHDNGTCLNSPPIGIPDSDVITDPFLNGDETIFASAKNLQSTLQGLKAVSGLNIILI